MGHPPKIELVERLVINIRAHTLRDIVPVALGFGGLTEMLLLIADEMLCARNDSSVLDSLDRLRHHDTSQNGIGRKSLPVSATIRVPAKRTSNGSQLDIHTLVTVLLAHGPAAEVGETPVPGSGYIDAGGESRNVVAWLCC